MKKRYCYNLKFKNMKKTNTLSIVIAFGLLLCGTVCAQKPVASNKKATSTSTAKNTTPSEETFMDRYYSFKKTNPNLTDQHAKYAACSHTKEKYLERYNALKDSYPKLKNFAAAYAMSEYAIEDFVKDGKTERVFKTKKTQGGKK